MCAIAWQRGNCHIPEAAYWQCECFFSCNEEKEGQERGNGRKWKDWGRTSWRCK